jgi:hypothetical protein
MKEGEPVARTRPRTLHLFNLLPKTAGGRRGERSETSIKPDYRRSR